MLGLGQRPYLEADAGDEMLRVGQLEDKETEPDQHPEVGGEALGSEAAVVEGVPLRTVTRRYPPLPTVTHLLGSCGR